MSQANQGPYPQTSQTPARQSAGPARQPIAARSRAEAIKQFIDDNAEMVNAANTLRIEINCNGAELVVKAERGFKVSEAYRIG